MQENISANDTPIQNNFIRTTPTNACNWTIQLTWTASKLPNYLNLRTIKINNCLPLCALQSHYRYALRWEYFRAIRRHHNSTWYSYSYLGKRIAVEVEGVSASNVSWSRKLVRNSVSVALRYPGNNTTLPGKRHSATRETTGKTTRLGCRLK